MQHVIHESYQFEATQIFQRSSCHFVVRLSADSFLEQFCLLVRLLTSVKTSFKIRACRIQVNFDAGTGNIIRVSQFNICIATVYQPLLFGIKHAFKEQYIEPIIREYNALGTFVKLLKTLRARVLSSVKIHVQQTRIFFYFKLAVRFLNMT